MHPTSRPGIALALSAAVAVVLTGPAAAAAAPAAPGPPRAPAQSHPPEGDSPGPEEETTAPDDETSAPDDETSAPDDDTTSPDEESTSPDEESTSPDEDTTSPTPTSPSPSPTDDGDDYTLFFFNFSDFYGLAPGSSPPDPQRPAAPPSGIDRSAVARWLVDWADTAQARAFDDVLTADEVDYCALGDAARAVEANPSEPPGLTRQWDALWDDLADAGAALCADPGDLAEVSDLVNAMRALGRFEGTYLS